MKTEENIERALRNANPVTPGMLVRANPAYAEAELVAEIFAEPVLTEEAESLGLFASTIHPQIRSAGSTDRPESPLIHSPP